MRILQAGPVALALMVTATAFAAPINYTDAPGPGNWSLVGGWDQNYKYPGNNDPADTAVIDQDIMLVDVNVPLMGMITVNAGGQLRARRSLTNANTVTVNSGALLEFGQVGSQSVLYYWNVILNDGGVWYGNLGGSSTVNGTFTVADNASVAMRHNGGASMSPKLNGAITAPPTSTITFESFVNPGIGALHLAGDNSAMLAALNINCPVSWSNPNSLGTNSGGTATVNPGGQVGGIKSGTGTGPLARDLLFTGGAVYGKASTSFSPTYTGQWSLQADVTITADADSSTAGWVRVDGPIHQDATPRKVLTQSAGGQFGAYTRILLSNPGNDFSVGLGIDQVTTCIATPGAQGSGPIVLLRDGRLALGAGPYVDWTLTNDLLGEGTCIVGDGSASYTLTLAGANVIPGTDSRINTTLTVEGNLAFAEDAGVPSTLNLDIIGQGLGAGIPPRVTHDTLAVTGTVTSLSNAVLSLSISGLAGDDLKGKLLPILTCANDLTGQTFRQINCPAGWQAAILGDQGTLYLKLAPEGVSEAFLQVTPTLLRFAAKAGDPDPAPQQIRVLNTGFAPSHWTATVRAPVPAWISLASSQGGDGDSCQVSVNRQSLPLGSYSAWIDIADPQAPNSPQTVLVALQVLPDTLLGTHSFTNNATRGTHPATVTTTLTGSAAGTITVDLSALPVGTQVYRAILAPHARTNTSNTSPGAGLPLQVESIDAPGAWLATQPPRHVNLDCTADVQRAMASDRTLRLNIVSWPGWYTAAQVIRLDVWCDQPVPTMETTTRMDAVHRDGDTMLTYREVEQPLSDYVITGAQYTAALNAINAGPEIRYRIYRAATPIDATTITQAELVDEIGPLSGWNVNWQMTVASTTLIPTLPIADDTLASPGTGIYVRRAHAPEAACYAVSRSVDGQEDLANWIPLANAMVAPLTEQPGTGMVLQWQKEQSYWYVEYYFARWECPPCWNVPSTVHNYLVSEPPVPPGPTGRGVSIYLHGAGGHIGNSMGFGFEGDLGALQVATNQIPGNYWYAFHENTGMIRPWAPVAGNGGGVVRYYPAARIWSFVDDFVCKRWNADRNHVLLSGYSMGSCGASSWGVHGGDQLAYVVPNDGNNIPVLLGPSGSFGNQAWNCPFEDSGETAWDYFDTCGWLRRHMDTDTPFITFANSRNDPYFAWNQAYLFGKALQETRRPHIFAWGVEGHGQMAYMPGSFDSFAIGVRIDRNKTLPAFTHCSLDGNPGDGNAAVGDQAGFFNVYLAWQPEDSTDSAGRWEMTCRLIDVAPQMTCTVDITPRRCQAFRARPGAFYCWTNTDLSAGAAVASGTVVADAYGLVTIPQTPVGKARNRIAITMQADLNEDGQVDTTDLMGLAAAWAKVQGEEGFDPRCDFNGDGTTDVLDLMLLSDNWAR